MTWRPLFARAKDDMMAKFGRVTFTGESGQDYAFAAYSRDTRFQTYCSCVRYHQAGGKYRRPRFLYPYIVGQTDNLQGQPLNHERKHCFNRKHANCVCVLPENDQNRRLALAPSPHKQTHLSYPPAAHERKPLASSASDRRGVYTVISHSGGLARSFDALHKTVKSRLGLPSSF